jgi:hypothetical protein
MIGKYLIVILDHRNGTAERNEAFKILVIRIR